MSFKREKVDIYWNLHKKLWSVKSRRTGRVLFHSNFVRLTDVIYVAQPAGRARVLKEHRKNVHAFVRGTLAPTPKDIPKVYKRKVHYNPYLAPHFFDCETMKKVTGDASVILTPNKEVLAL